MPGPRHRIVTIFLAALIACDDEPVGGNLISYTQLHPSQNHVVIFSDANGKVLFMQASSRSTTHQYNKLADTKVDVSHIYHTYANGRSDWSVITYKDVAAGTYIQKINDHPYFPPVGLHVVRVPNAADYAMMYINSNENCISNNPNGDTIRYLSLCETFSKLYVTYQRNAADVPRFVFRDVQVGTETILDATTLNSFPEMAMKPFQFDQAADVQVTLFGTGYRKYYFLSRASADGQTNMNFFYPAMTPKGLFDQYLVRIHHTLDREVFFENFNTNDTINFDHTPLPAFLQNIQGRMFPEIAFTATGEAHYYEATLTETTPDRTLSWTVYGPYGENTHFVLPDLNHVFDSTVVTENLRLSNITFHESADLENYQGFYTAMLGDDQPNRNRRRKVYTNLSGF
ncbi:MAG TPA: hypothetical protein VEB86_06565 [Chryseosolibacter sp.]|nr:hypothetical protein [Chryseosolibacter sp.]